MLFDDDSAKYQGYFWIRRFCYRQDFLKLISYLLARHQLLLKIVDAIYFRNFFYATFIFSCENP